MRVDRITQCAIVAFLIAGNDPAYGNTETASPPDSTLFSASRVHSPIRIDGRLSEKEWEQVLAIDGFVQREPVQGAQPSVATSVKLLYDDRYLYVAAICYQHRDDVRTQNLRRDFEWAANDVFGIAIDGFMDRRHAVTFQTTPYGNQRDAQVFDSDTLNDDWDGLWQVQTTILRDRWIAEMAIPWKTLRYHADTKQLGVIFIRNYRKANEETSSPAVPRPYTVYRMAYAGVLSDVETPPPSANVQLTPYLLASGDESNQSDLSFDVKPGGEVKWAINSNTVLDATVNMDFAQADVDRQVVNLDRFNVSFPEKRQFFLEGANIFNASVTDWIRPFFSRRIGLDDGGNPVPIDVGVRMTNQDSERQAGALFVRQRGGESAPDAYFGVLRYSQNRSTQSRIGGMLTYRNDRPDNSDGELVGANSNVTYTADGLWRPLNTVDVKAMLSGSYDGERGNGLGGQVLATYTDKSLYVGWLQYLNHRYHPGVGLELLDLDYTMTSPAVFLDLRPEWLPDFVRSYQPRVAAYIFNNTDDGRLLFGYAPITPLRLVLQSGALLHYVVEPNWQRLDEPFAPVGIEIAPGDYSYIRHRLTLSSDQSAKVAASVTAETGDYFDGELDTYTASTRVAPVPHIELSADYELNRLSNLGVLNADEDTHLIGVSARLALNPQLQLVGFYQHSTSSDRSIWNARLSWEYRPLSHVYVVFNRNAADSMTMPTEDVVNNQFIAKVTYLTQF